MNIRSAFSEALISQPKLAFSRNPEEFLGEFFHSAYSKDDPLFHILSCGSINATFPWTFELKGMDCFMLLYTKQGSGKAHIKGKNYALAPSTLLLLDCNQPIRIDITADPWQYHVLFISGSQLSYFKDLLPESRMLLLPVLSHSNLLMKLEHLPMQATEPDLSKELFVSACLNHILTDCIRNHLSEESVSGQIPSYIKKMKELFDTKFEDPYSLDELEEALGISKYRLCREFGAAYQMSPLQYLNKRRIEAAAYLLLNSRDKIHRIGSQVGIDNTNHFIHLFKKYTGCTPSEYKQRMTD